MGRLYTNGTPITTAYAVNSNAPFDTRLTVRYIADLTDGDNGGVAAYVYKGMVVYVQEDNSLYVYIGSSSPTWKNKKTGAPMNGGLASNWVKIDSFVDPESFLEYYQEKIGAKILDSTDEFSTIENPFNGQFVFVRDGSDASEDESGLYIYDGGLWVRILTGSGDVTGDYVKREELEDYLKKDEIPDFLTDSDLDGYVKVEDLAGYLTAKDIADLAKKSDLDGFIKMEDLPDFLTDSDLDDFATKRYVDKKIEDLVGGAPETLDTLKEIAEALEDNATMSKVAEAISTKANSADVYTKDQVYTKAEVDAKIDALPTEGSFPELEGSEEKEFVPGLAKVEDVIDYVADAITEATPDLSDYAKKEDIPVVPENVSAFNNDAGYLTEHQDLSEYAKKEELPVEGSFPELDGSEAEFEDGYAKVSDVVDYVADAISDAAPDLTPYATKEELPTKVSELENDVPYLTEHQDLSDYAKYIDLIDFLTGSDLDDYVKTEVLEGYLQPEDIADLAKKSDLDGYVKVEDAVEFLTASDLDIYATKNYVDKKIEDLVGGAPQTLDTLKEIADALQDNATMQMVADAISTKANSADVYTKAEVDAKIDALPDEGSFPEIEGSEEKEFTPGLATVEGVIDYVADAITDAAPDLTPYATKEELPTKVSDLTNDAGYLTEHQDLSEYALKSELPVEGVFPEISSSESEFTPGVATVEGVIDYVADAITDAAPDLTPYATKEELPTKVSELENDVPYLTEHQDLSEYAKKEELPTKVSELENDVPYLTEHQDLSDYAEKDYVDVAIGSLDIPEHSEVLTTDGTQPTSGSGLSVSDNPENAFVEEVYVDDYLHAGVYYTSKGINSASKNGGSELEDVSSIILSNGGSSWIKLNHRGTIRINIADDTLGFNLENIVGLIDDGTEYQNPYAGHPYSPSPIIISLADGCFLKFDKDIDFTGFTETRDDESEEYIFGDTGSNYEDLDFYSVNVLPTVNAYVDGVSTRVLTEGDKAELLNRIEGQEIEPISREEILSIF